MKNIFLIFLFCSPIFLQAQIEKKLDNYRMSTAPNKLGFYKIVLDTPIKLSKFKKWVQKNDKYEIVYYNKYSKLVAGAQQVMVSRVGYLLKRDATPKILAGINSNASFVKQFMTSDFYDVRLYEDYLEEEEAIAAVEAERMAKERAAREKERAIQAEAARKEASMGLHCLEVVAKSCGNDTYNFEITNSCELPYRIKFSYLVRYKKAAVETITVPENGTVALKQCESIHDSYYLSDHRPNTFILFKKSDNELALHYVMSVYDDVYYCRKCEGDGVNDCSYCFGKGTLDRNGPMTCTHCQGRGGFTCGPCDGGGIIGLE